jgi:hypothetical protein
MKSNQKDQTIKPPMNSNKKTQLVGFTVLFLLIKHKISLLLQHRKILNLQ